MKVGGTGVLSNSRQPDISPITCPANYQKFVDGYKVVSLDLTVKYLEIIEIELELIYQN